MSTTIKPTVAEYTAAVLAMAELIPFFPQSEPAQRMIVAALESFVGTREQLAWLTQTAASHMRAWSSLADLRGLFCTKWPPADGRREHCEVPGFTPADCEADFFRREAEETASRIEGWKAEKLLAPAAESAPFPLGRPKLLAKPERRAIAAARDQPAQRPLVEVEKEIAANLGPRRSPEEAARLTAELAEQLARRKA